MPQEFFNNHVLPNYRDWLASPLDQRLAKNAVSDTNNMAERVWRYWNDKHELSQVYGAFEPGVYRNELAKRFPDFGLIRDVADAHKHVVLGRANRRVTRSDQTKPGQRAWGEGAFGEGAFGGGDELLVTLDDGTKRPLSAILKNTIEMWERLLKEWSL